MELDSNLLKEFAKMTNDSETKTETKYLRGTIVKNSGGKYVQIDGSSTATPISEIVDVEEGDRVLVTIENHKATIIGNFTFSPSGRKEQEAIDKANTAQETATNANATANTAQLKAQEASEKADEAMNNSSIASTSSDEAKQQAAEALAKANAANENVQEAKDLATQASTEATEAKNQAAASQAASADAQAEVTKLQNEVKEAQEGINEALAELESQGGEITIIKETYSTKVETENAKAELSTEIDAKVGELQTTVEKDYATKTENVELEGRLQSQITLNAEGFASQATKIEKLEGDTAKAQEDVDEALAKAATAQTTADTAKSTADEAKSAAEQATTDAQAAADKAQIAQNAADAATAAANAADKAVQEAQGDLDEAKQNLIEVSSRIDATEADIADAQAKVDAAQEGVNNALADAAEARLAATKAQEAADQAQTDAETAQGVANTAQQKAENAQTAANNAQAAADKAQEDVASLTSRVTTAETNISNNAEQIRLNANKTEEIGDKLENDYYKKTETDALIKVQSDRITSTVTKVETVEKTANDAQAAADAAQEDIDNLEVGGRNLIPNTKIFTGENIHSSLELSGEQYNDFNIRSYDSSSSTSGTKDIVEFRQIYPEKLGDTYTLSFYAKGSGENKLVTYFHGVSGYVGCRKSVQSNGQIGEAKDGSTAWTLTEEWTRYWVTWTLFDVGDVSIEKYVLFRLWYGGSASICGIKLEKGNKATDWTPAPKDVDESIHDAQNTANIAQTNATTANEAVIVNKTMIEQLSDMIKTLVVDENGVSQMTQDGGKWRFDLTSINGNLAAIEQAMADKANQTETNTALNELKNLIEGVEAKTAYITIGKDENNNPCIELGKSDNDFKVRITNTAIDFLEGSTKIAYANNNTFYAEKMIVKNELQIGAGPGFVWRTRSNGNMGLVYISG